MNIILYIYINNKHISILYNLYFNLDPHVSQLYIFIYHIYLNNYIYIYTIKFESKFNASFKERKKNNACL